MKVARWPAKDFMRTHWPKAATLGPTTLAAHASPNRLDLKPKRRK